MRRILQIATLLVATLTSTIEAQTYQIGLADLRIEDTLGQRNLDGFIWYPTKSATPPETYHENAVWAGIEAIKNAPPASGSFPLIVLSHGMYGNAMNQSWLAAGLAKRGYVVAAANHPGTSTWERDPDDARQLWQRPKDMSRIIDHLLTTSSLNTQIDANRIFMAGHSLGGFTALALAGGRYSAAKANSFCDTHPGELVCGIFKGWHIAETTNDQVQMEADLSDERIKGFAVFDLGGTQTFSTQSLANINKPLLVFGAPNNIHGLDLDIESRALVMALPANKVTYLEPSSLAHFDFLGECKPAALEILKQEEPNDVFVCLDGTTERHAEHQMILDEVDNFWSAL